MNENKCIYCNFKHPDNIGADIISGFIWRFDNAI